MNTLVKGQFTCGIKWIKYTFLNNNRKGFLTAYTRNGKMYKVLNVSTKNRGRKDTYHLNFMT